MSTRRAALAQVAWMLGGCSGLLGPAEAPMSTALIDTMPQGIPQAARTRGVMLVHAPTCRPLYDTTRMAYSVRAQQVDFFARHEWAERPAAMLQPLVVRTLEAARCCRAVTTVPSRGGDELELRTHIDELLQDFAIDPPQLRLRLRIALSANGKPIATREIALAQAMRAKNAEAGVASANEAVAMALRALAQLVVQALA